VEGEGDVVFNPLPSVACPYFRADPVHHVREPVQGGIAQRDARRAARVDHVRRQLRLHPEATASERLGKHNQRQSPIARHEAFYGWRVRLTPKLVMATSPISVEQRPITVRRHNWHDVCKGALNSY